MSHGELVTKPFVIEGLNSKTEFKLVGLTRLLFQGSLKKSDVGFFFMFIS